MSPACENPPGCAAPRVGDPPGFRGARASAGHPSQPESKRHKHPLPHPPGRVLGGLRAPQWGPHRQPPCGPGLPASPSRRPRKRPATCLLRVPEERRLRTRGAEVKAQGRAGALPPSRRGSRGCRRASSRAAASRRLPRRARAPEPGPPRGSARAQCSRPGCKQASALGPAHAPAIARLRLAPPVTPT